MHCGNLVSYERVCLTWHACIAYAISMKQGCKASTYKLCIVTVSLQCSRCFQITLVLATWNGHIHFLSHILKFHSYWTIVQSAEYGRSSTKSKYNKVKAVLVAGILHVVQQFLTGAHVRYISYNRQSSSRWLCNIVCRQMWCPALVCTDSTQVHWFQRLHMSTSKFGSEQQL